MLLFGNSPFNIRLLSPLSSIKNDSFTQTFLEVENLPAKDRKVNGDDSTVIC